MWTGRLLSATRIDPTFWPVSLASRLTTHHHNKHRRVGCFGQSNHTIITSSQRRGSPVPSGSAKRKTKKFHTAQVRKCVRLHGGESTVAGGPRGLKRRVRGATQPLPRERRHRTRPAGLPSSLPAPGVATLPRESSPSYLRAALTPQIGREGSRSARAEPVQRRRGRVRQVDLGRGWAGAGPA